MRTENRKIKLGGVLFAILLCSFFGVYSYTASNGKSNIVADTGQMLSLVKPVFAQSASSETTFLEDEAGMSMYVNIGRSIDLALAKTVYRTIEKETSDYVVGSLSLPNSTETDDVHCFVHKDGWIVVYYLKAEPISKIIDWNYYSGGTLTKTKLLVGLEKMTLVIGATTTGSKYYNFQYPYADKWMIIIESMETSGTDSFNLKIPSEFTVYERSWSHYGSGYYEWYVGYRYAIFQIDGNTISSIDGSGVTRYAQLNATHLTPDVFHTSSTGSYVDQPHRVGIVLAYKET